MKKPKSTSTKKFWQKSNKGKMPEELNGNWCEEVIDELLKGLEDEKEINNKLKNQLWEELNKGNSLNKLHGKMLTGEMPNDLECALINYIRI